MELITRTVISAAFCVMVWMPSAAQDVCQNPSFSLPETADFKVQFQMQPAPLKPQLEALLKKHLAVQAVVWQLDTPHFWPTEYLIQAHSWEALIEKLAQPYQIRVSIHANQVAVIDELPQVGRL